MTRGAREPASHDGSSVFTFTLTFSEDMGGLNYTALRDSAFDATGGNVTNAGRQTLGSNQHWNIWVSGICYGLYLLRRHRGSGPRPAQCRITALADEGWSLPYRPG